MEKSIEADKNSIEIINNALDETFAHCKFDAQKNNQYTSKYCSLKLQLDEFTDFNKSFSSSKYIPLYIGGVVVIIASGMIAFAIFIVAKRREIKVFTTQQTIPVNQEIIGKMAPTIGDAAGTIGKDLAQGITSGIQEGLKQNNEVSNSINYNFSQNNLTNNSTSSTSSENNNPNNPM